jgi:hypothetical protein
MEQEPIIADACIDVWSYDGQSCTYIGGNIPCTHKKGVRVSLGCVRKSLGLIYAVNTDAADSTVHLDQLVKD